MRSMMQALILIGFAIVFIGIGRILTHHAKSEDWLFYLVAILYAAWGLMMAASAII